MVLSRNDKRKRKEGDLVDLMDPLAEAPKSRTKIHAQRKFAQGVVTPVFSPASTPVKEKEKVKPTAFTELISHKRPNTEDFLTFLCFRGTSVLPPSLNFFGIGLETEPLKNGAPQTPPDTPSFSKTNNISNKNPSLKSEQKSLATTTVNKPFKVKIPNDMKKQIPKISKTAKLKTANTAIQALKKKYKEQRLAKQMLKKKYKSSSMKTRSGANTIVQASTKSAKSVIVAKKIISHEVEKKRHGLRSTGIPESEKISLPMFKKHQSLKKQLKQKSLATKLKKKIVSKEATNVDCFSSKTAKKSLSKITATKVVTKKIIKKAKKLEVRRINTRSRRDIETPSIIPETTVLTSVSITPDPVRRPSRKTKEAAAIYMEILGRKLVSPDLDNDDNMSLDSFPELPSVKKIAQTEKEIKAKAKTLKVPVNDNELTAIGKDKEKEKVKDKVKPKEKNKEREKETENKKVIEGKTKSNSKQKIKINVKKTVQSSKLMKKKIEKPVIMTKTKRLVKVQKYKEVNSDDDSMTSEDLLQLNEAIKASTATRRSAPPAPVKDDILESRDLRSSRSLVSARKSLEKSNSSQKNLTSESVKNLKNTETQVKNKVFKESSTKEVSKEDRKEKLMSIKRKRDEKEKETVPKQKFESSKNKNKPIIMDEESEEELLGDIISKMKKKKNSEKDDTNRKVSSKKSTESKNNKTNTNVTSDENFTIASADTPKTQITVETGSSSKLKAVNSSMIVSATTVKISDDEESFRGFTKKSTELYKSKAEVSNLFDEIDSKVNITKSQNVLNKSTINSKNLKLITSHAKFSQEDIDEKKSTVPDSSVKVELDYKVSKALNVVDMSKSLLHSRKERVNMSTEQIEKWLNESSLAKEESKAEMEKLSNHSLEKSKHSNTPPPIHNHLLISPKIQHLVRPVNVTLSKLSDRLKKASMSPISSSRTSVVLTNNQVPGLKPQLPVVSTMKEIEDRDKKEEKNDEKKEGPSSAPPSRKMSKDSSFGDGDSDIISKSDANSMGDSMEKKSLSSPEKKVFFHQRKSFLPKVKERKSISNASAFSPENESSVYAFETETEAPVNTPFRRRARDMIGKEGKNKTSNSQSNICEGKSEEDTINISKHLNSSEEARKKELLPPLEKKTTKNFELPKNFTDLTNMQVLPLDKLTTSWSNVNCSASIAVQVNFDDQKLQQKQIAENENDISLTQKCTEISTQTDTSTINDDDDDNGQLFYIPLQAVTRNSSAQGGQQLIQGVAVKLGTEGPTGPNQRVLLKAKLVTKPPVSVARCPPIGTVQPTARTPQNNVTESLNLPSTSNIEISEDEFKIQENKEIKIIGNKPNNKVLNNEKIIKSPKTKERKTSIDAIKSGKKIQTKSKHNDTYSPINNTTFPKIKYNEEARLVEAPTFRPTEKDFHDPLEYIDKIRPIAEKFGICKVIPPSNFKPECKVSDDMRFTAYNQYIHRMLHRWGPNVKEMMAIKKYLATQSISLTQPPWIGGMEVDLPHLYQTVQNLGGLKEVIEKKRWQKVADGMKIPRSAQDRVTKLDDIYCKYLLPYDTLSQDEREKLFRDVEADWKKREKRSRQDLQLNDNEDEDYDDNTEELEECIVKGRNMPLNAFYRIARNTQRMWFGENQRSSSGGAEMEDTSADEVEAAFWKHVVEKKRHVCVHSASIDSSGRGFGFSVAKNSPFGRHPWNLKILTNNGGSVLRALGPQMGVTVPTLHVGMLFSACCWYRDPHGLPWIEYLHTGAKKIWYGIPNELNETFREALTKMFPRYCKDKTIWLPSDIAMVPPEMLVANGVPLCQTVQEPGQFIIVFPKAFTSSICTGYVVSESVYFAQMSWLKTAEEVFKDLRDSCEPSIFSFERLLFSIINDSRSHIEVLKQILPTVIKVCEKEIGNRKKLKELGLVSVEKLLLPEHEKKGKGKKVREEEGDYECDTCRANLFVSLVSNSTDGSIFCLTHAIQYIEKKKQVLKNCKLMYAYNEKELDDLILKLKDRIEAKSKKTNQAKHAK